MSFIKWKEHEDFPGYLFSDSGAVLKVSNNKPMALRINREGFVYVGLTKDGTQIIRAVAPIVAKLFCDPPKNESYNSIIHLNGDRKDCRSINLEYRPRWFATRYHSMFSEEPLRVGVYVVELDKHYGSLRTFCTTYGMIETDIYECMNNGTPCFQYGWHFERIPVI